MALAGRCECGTALTWVARDPDAHLRCFGLRWCGVCGEAAEYRRDCKPCMRRRVKASRRNRPLTPRTLEAKRRASREYMRRQRRKGTEVYLRDKERKRQRYATDPAWAEAKRESFRRWHSTRAVESVAEVA